jgi:hypothetical protein
LSSSSALASTLLMLMLPRLVGAAVAAAVRALLRLGVAPLEQALFVFLVDAMVEVFGAAAAAAAAAVEDGVDAFLRRRFDGGTEAYSGTSASLLSPFACASCPMSSKLLRTCSSFWHPPARTQRGEGGGSSVVLGFGVVVVVVVVLAIKVAIGLDWQT